jgi:tRNA(Ile)-lysidine synthase
VSAADAAASAPPLSSAEAAALFADLVSAPALILAVSGGPDSTALLWLAARWRARRKRGPKLIAVTIDHGLRPGSAHEAKQVAKLARKLGVTHRILRWNGKKPASRLQESARQARYGLLAEAAHAAGALHILAAHTLDDQAETVLMRFLRGSGLAGLGAMARVSRLPTDAKLLLVRPFLDIPKRRLTATLKAAKIPYASDPSNADPRFTRVRMRALLAALAGEGLGAERLAQLGRRMRRADAALEAAVDTAVASFCPGPWSDGAPVTMTTEEFATLPAEIGLRLLGRAIAFTGNEGAVELAKLEALGAALAAHLRAPGRFRRTLAGAIITLTASHLVVERAPARRPKSVRRRP